MKAPAALLLSILLSATAHALDESVADLQRRIQKITFPSIEFRGVSLQEALTDLTKRSIEQDGDPNVTKRGVKFLVIPDTGRVGDAGGDETAPEKIRYSGTSVTLETVIKAIASGANRDVYVTSSGIVICPAGTEPFPNAKERKGEILEKL
jgi:hypothetical protein